MRAVVAVYLPLILLGLVSPVQSSAQADTLEVRRRLAEQARVMSALDSLQLSIQNVTMANFPEIGLIVECGNNCKVLDTITPSSLRVMENGVLRPVTRIKKIDVDERVPVDFMFVVDVTGTMQAHINGIRNNIGSFVASLRKRGIDYRIGLALFSDVVEDVYEPTDSLELFMKWMSKVTAFGGFDEKENALQGLYDASVVKFRPNANKVLVLLTDAGYHQLGERGNGRTRYNKETLTQHLASQSIRVFCIIPPHLRQYDRIVQGTRGAAFNLDLPFSKILDQYSDQLTNLYTIYYSGDSKLRSDSINVSILDDTKRELVKQIIPIVEIGRKFIIENLLFPTGAAVLADTVEELDVLVDFMKDRPAVEVLIEGHTDNVGAIKLNKALSLARAEAARSYLMSRGIDGKRIKVIGYGPSRPIAPNTTEFGRSLNRRTEIVITAK